MRTLEQMEERHEWLQEYGVILLKEFAALPKLPPLKQYSAVMKRINAWKQRLDDFEREDRCWMCFTKTKELGQLNWVIVPTICIDCEVNRYGIQNSRDRKAAENYYYTGHF